MPNHLGTPGQHIRERCRDSFEKRVPQIEKIIDNPRSQPGDIIRAMDLLGKYGVGVKQEVTATNLNLDGASPDVLKIALINALRDPGVRGWLDNERPDLKQQLLGAGDVDETG